MHCKFLDHGIALAYDQVVKPCCTWEYDKDWARQHHLSQVDLDTWHNSQPIIEIKNQLARGEWPEQCRACKETEQAGRGDSMRLNAESAYSNYNDNDITLEIRPGAVCNFACQTCWPEASSRVAQYQHQAKIIDIKNINSNSINNFDFLMPIANRIQNVVVLGGEPFYDKNCLQFLDWARDNLSADITMFTNGSAIKWDWVQQYSNPITMVFSIDAIGKPAEYIRYGTDWDLVYKNYYQIQQYTNVELRVNITTSPYNYIYLEEIIDLLITKWPAVVSFGTPFQDFLREAVIPIQHRQCIITSLDRAISKLQGAKIEIGQKQNAINAVASIKHNLENSPHNVDGFDTWRKYVRDLDQVKNINIQDYCEFVGNILQ
jgi:hypothetical protein